LKMWIEKT